MRSVKDLIIFEDRWCVLLQLYPKKDDAFSCFGFGKVAYLDELKGGRRPTFAVLMNRSRIEDLRFSPPHRAIALFGTAGYFILISLS